MTEFFVDIGHVLLLMASLWQIVDTKRNWYTSGMGFFSKLKANINHGGVKVVLSAPASVSIQDAQMPVSVQITANESPQTITGVRVEIIAESHEQAFSTSNTSSSSTERHIVANTEYNQPFTLAAGESKAVPLVITMNQGAALNAQLPEGSPLAAVAGAFQKLQTISETMNSKQYVYTIKASVHIDGITFGAADERPIQILKPGEIGTAFNTQVHI